MGSEEHISFFHEGDEGRLDLVLLEHFTEDPEKNWLNRSQLKKLIADGSVTVNGKLEKRAGAKVKSESLIELTLIVEESHIAPFDIPLDIIYEDEMLAVVNKPAGLSMHPGAGNKEHTLANALVHRYGMDSFDFGDLTRPGIVHRIDKDTTGLVVTARTRQAHALLSAQFAEKSAGRKYIALALATPRGGKQITENSSGRVEADIGRHRRDRKLMSVVDDGKKAVTNWTVLERFPWGVMLDLKLETGRTHQIRVHLNHAGSPLIGDRQYGDFSCLPKKLSVQAANFGRQALHAYYLSFKHPLTGELKVFESEVPADMKSLIDVFRGFGK